MGPVTDIEALAGLAAIARELRDAGVLRVKCGSIEIELSRSGQTDEWASIPIPGGGDDGGGVPKFEFPPFAPTDNVTRGG